MYIFVEFLKTYFAYGLMMSNILNSNNILKDGIRTGSIITAQSELVSSCHEGLLHKALEWKPHHKVLFYGGASGVVVIAVGNEHGDTSSIPGRYWLHFT